MILIGYLLNLYEPYMELYFQLNSKTLFFKEVIVHVNYLNDTILVYGSQLVLNNEIPLTVLYSTTHTLIVFYHMSKIL